MRLAGSPPFPRRAIIAFAATVCLSTIASAQAPTASAPSPAAPAEPEPIFVDESSVGYIDSAIPATQFRLRYDSTYDSRRNTRAEFLWAWPQPVGPGLPKDESKFNDQRVTTYFEYAPNSRFGGFVEIGVRFVNPEINANAEGLDDMNLGFKWAIVQNRDFVATLQFRTYLPTGDADAGLGTNHVSFEPALLTWTRLTDRLRAEGEFRYWIPSGGTDGRAGSVIRYGLGATYDLYSTPTLRISPVVEFVGWTVLDGQTKFLTPGGAVVQDADGDTIINGKFGVRTSFGCSHRNQIYLGYGRSLTGENWYRDVVRLEYRLAF